MKIGDFVVYKPMWNIDITYKITDISLLPFNNYIEIQNSNKEYWGNKRFAHKDEIQLANPDEIARYIQGILTR